MDDGGAELEAHGLAAGTCLVESAEEAREVGFGAFCPERGEGATQFIEPGALGGVGVDGDMGQVAEGVGVYSIRRGS